MAKKSFSANMTTVREILKKKFGPNVDKLTKKEFEYFQILQSNAGVLFVKGRPGEAKSAIFRTIANKMGWRYEDIRLSQVDESEVGIFPKVREHYFDHVPPRWAYEANNSPVLVIFEELNRAILPVRNAALQILNEREVGQIKFNQNVFMVSSGNLGDEDGTDTEELDAAIKNRLITLSHKLTLEDWIDGYADVNVHPTIIEFLKAEPGHFYKKATSAADDAFASARSWSNFSAYICSIWSKESSPSEWLDSTYEIVNAYVGATSGAAFHRWVKTLLQISIDDVLNKFDSIKDTLEKTDNSIKSELINKLESFDLRELKPIQFANMIKFLNIIRPDERTGYFKKLVDNDQYAYLFNDKKKGVPVMKELVKNFKAEMTVLENSSTKR